MDEPVHYDQRDLNAIRDYEYYTQLMIADPTKFEDKGTGQALAQARNNVAQAAALRRDLEPRYNDALTRIPEAVAEEQREKGRENFTVAYGPKPKDTSHLYPSLGDGVPQHPEGNVRS